MSAPYAIERGVPIPGRLKPSGWTNPPGVPPKYPLRRMEPGDSFLVPCAPAEGHRVALRIHSAARAVGARVTTRRGTRGVRAWLLAAPTVPLQRLAR